MDQPHIVGSWVTDDKSANHLECALTDVTASGGNGQEQVIALRDTAYPDNIIFATQGQLKRFVDSAQQQNSATARLVGAGHR
jgi:hypothetical protein